MAAVTAGRNLRTDDRLSDLKLYNVDYSPWQRVRTPTSSCLASKVSPSASSTSCNSSSHPVPCHLRPSDKKRLTAVNAARIAAAQQSTQNEQLRILQLQILMKKQMLEDAVKREVQILEENFKLKDVLELDEKNAHENIKQLLRKYERFRGGMGNISSKFSTELKKLMSETESSRLRLMAYVENLEKEVKELDDQLSSKQTEVEMLRNYMDKEQPLKTLQIAELKRKIESLKVEQSKEITELQRVVELDKDKMEKTHQKKLRNIRETVAKNAVSSIEPAIEDIAVQNKQLQQEIIVHKHEIRRLEDANKQLSAEVKQLLHDPQTNVRFTMFPELFSPPVDKCTPDISVQEWLPI